MMRIGMMADVYKPHVSGITNYISLNKKYLEMAGHEVFVFTFGDEDYADNETNVIRSPGLPLVDTGYYLSLRHNQSAQKLLRKMDVVHIHHPFLSGRLTLRYCKPRGIPMVYTNHTRYDLYAQAYLPALPESFGETFLKAYLPNFCQSVDLVVAPSPGMRNVLLKVGVEAPIEVIPNGVEIKPFKGKIEPVDRLKLGFGSDDFVLVYSGRLGPEKNLPFLLRSFNGAAQAFENLYLLMIGDGPERENLVDRVRHMGIENRVHFTGMVEYDQIPRYLAMADAFVTASVTEVHPLSVIEAMAAGLPVLGIESPGVGDTIEDGKTGFIVAEQDLAAFTAKMVRMVTDSDLRQKMSRQARETSEIYAIERTTKILLEHYTRLVDRSVGRKRGMRARWIRFWDSVRS
jgi:1,2-diacylglycerol 3-alpha-glucosyltransferase